jgi:hypothetical protein
MPLLLAIIALCTPRLAIIILWLFSGWFNGVFVTRGWPILGFIFLPLTLLWYSAVMNWFGGQWNLLTVLVMILAVCADLGSGKKAAWKK